MSWKVRRTSAKLLSAIIGTRQVLLMAEQSTRSTRALKASPRGAKEAVLEPHRERSKVRRRLDNLSSFFFLDAFASVLTLVYHLEL